MKTVLRRTTIGLALMGLGLGGGAILLTATDARTDDALQHVNSEWVCESGCSPDAQLCCVRQE